jgi:hypothetical protein
MGFKERKKANNKPGIDLSCRIGGTFEQLSISSRTAKALYFGEISKGGHRAKISPVNQHSTSVSSSIFGSFNLAHDERHRDKDRTMDNKEGLV